MQALLPVGPSLNLPNIGPEVGGTEPCVVEVAPSSVEFRARPQVLAVFGPTSVGIGPKTEIGPPLVDIGPRATDFGANVAEPIK